MARIKIKYYKPIINFPDFQTRVYKNSPVIKWEWPVHERISGVKTFAKMPTEERFALYHVKSIGRQEFQNNYYLNLTNRKAAK